MDPAVVIRAGFSQSLEIQELVPEIAIEARHVAVLPRSSHCAKKLLRRVSVRRAHT
jgi:hypothetical protein